MGINKSPRRIDRKAGGRNKKTIIKSYPKIDYEKKKVTPITYDEHNRDTSNDPFKGTNIEGKD